MMKSIVSSGLAAILAAGYAYFAYTTEAWGMFSKNTVAVGVFSVCLFTMLASYSRSFLADSLYDFIASVIFFLLLFAGLLLTATTMLDIGTYGQVRAHCAAFVPIGTALLATQINSRKHTYYPPPCLVLMLVGTVVPYVVIGALVCMFPIYKWASHAAPTDSPLVKRDSLAALVCNIFFTISILHGFSISLAYALQTDMSWGFIPAFQWAYHVIPFSIALIVLYRIRNAMSLRGLVFYLFAAPAAMLSGYVIFPLLFVFVRSFNPSPRAIN